MSELQKALEGYAEATARLVAVRVVEHLQANAPFTPEVIDQIIDHVSPNGVAYRNGFSAGFDRAIEALNDTGARECKVAACHLSRLKAISKPR